MVVPEMLLVSIAKPKTVVEIRGNPGRNIVITLVSSPHIFLEPVKITLTKNKTSSTISVNGEKSGFIV